MERVLLAILALAVTGSAARADECLWGSFGPPRVIANASLPSGNAYTMLRPLLAANGVTLYEETTLLTPEYLAHVDVFYTGGLAFTPATAEEAVALHDWVAAGGTLIVTGDYLYAEFYETLTAPFGVTGWEAAVTSGNATPTTQHPVTLGVDAITYAADATFEHGTDARRLAENVQGGDFMVVMEPATGFDLGGRVLVLGDSNLFMTGYVHLEDNRLLAANIANWSCRPSSTLFSACFGDGSGAPCGCGNESDPDDGTGCLNGLELGAQLTWSGSTSLAADDFVLISQHVTNHMGMFFQGDGALAGGAGLTFGDGIRCCGENVVRLEMVDPPGPGAAVPASASTSVSIARHPGVGPLMPGDTRCYQHWYRDLWATSCGNGFNLSNALVVTWHE